MNQNAHSWGRAEGKEVSQRRGNPVHNHKHSLIQPRLQSHPLKREKETKRRKSNAGRASRGRRLRLNIF